MAASEQTVVFSSWNGRLVESAKHRHDRGCVQSAQIRVTDGGRVVWCCPARAGGVSGGSPLTSSTPSPQSLSHRHGSDVEGGRT